MRSYSPGEVLKIKLSTLELPTQWREFLGEQNDTGVWFVWGASGGGKSEFVMHLLKLFDTLKINTVYNSLEEGCTTRHIRQSIKRNGLERSKHVRITTEDLADLTERMRKQRAPRVAIIDTVQYFDIYSLEQYKELKRTLSNRLLIFISHVSPDGRNPDGSIAQRIKRDSDTRIWIEGFRAHNKGRTMGTTNEYTIWHEGATQYYGTNDYN